MNIVNRIIIIFVANFIALVLSAAILPGFHMVYRIVDLIVLVGILTLIYVILLPIVKAVLSPLIIITAGLLSLVINAAVLYIVDVYSGNIAIDNLATLFFSTIIFIVINSIILAAVRFGTTYKN